MVETLAEMFGDMSPGSSTAGAPQTNVEVNYLWFVAFSSVNRGACIK